MQYLDTYVGLSLEEVGAVSAEHDMQSQMLIPFAKDVDGSLQCIKLDSGTVVNWEPDEKMISEDLKMNFGQYLESIRDRLLMKKLMYEEGLGLYQAQ